MKELFDEVRAQCLSAVWAQGVKLARAKDSVTLERRSDQELVVRVQAPGQPLYTTAVLYPKDLEWTCDCPGPTDPCQHVAAAVIAVHHAAERGETPPAAAEIGAEMVYALRRSGPGELKLERFVVAAGKRVLFEGTLLAAAQKYGVRPGPRDLTVDRIVTAAVRGVLRTAVWPTLLEALGGSKLELDGAVLRADPEPVQPRARVFDEGSRSCSRSSETPSSTKSWCRASVAAAKRSGRSETRSSAVSSWNNYRSGAASRRRNRRAIGRSAAGARSQARGGYRVGTAAAAHT